MSSFDDDRELPEPFFAPDFPTPGVGRVAVPWGSVGPDDHYRGFSLAFDQAIRNFGRGPGTYRAKVEFSATVEVRNPGGVIEYCATFV